MWIIPAIDLLEGRCVRLQRGDYGSARIYDEDPAGTARRFAEAGARWLHVVDLDAARGQGRANLEALAAIRRAFPHSIQTGGGIRTEEDILRLLSLGLDRLVLGTVLARDPERVAAWCARHGRALWGGIDALAGRVKVAGWEQEGGAEDLELARRAAGLGLGGIVYTNIARDGTLEGPDIERTCRVAEASGLPVILSGGISRNADVEEVLRRAGCGLEGVIVGKAIYEGRVDLAALLRDHDGPA